MELDELVPKYGLEYLGLHSLGEVYWNLSTPALYEVSVRRFEAQIAHLGPLVVSMGQHTGRAAKDKYIVEEPETRDEIWWSKVNVRYPEERFESLFNRMLAYLRGKTVFVQDCFAGADPNFRHPVRVITEYAWHSLFARNMFIQPHDPQTVKNFRPEFTVLQCPNFHADSEEDKTRSGTFVVLNVSRKLIIIGGTAYAGEIKKSIFSALNFLLPTKEILSMHCSANVSRKDPDDVAIFFGLSGTGKTTLSADPNRDLIGDDEHGWSDDGIFNFEGGCYAKVIKLSKEAEPEIYDCTRRFGTILENVSVDPGNRKVDLDDDSLTENTRASYPLSHLPSYVESGMGVHPRTIIMLTADAFGVLPPLAKLSTEQAMYHFISGYTAKVAGTEKGVTEPTATFSACFGAPFMMRHPSVYAQLLEKKIKKNNSICWLVNTGWSGGPYGVGSRMKIRFTRALLNAVLDGTIANIEMYEDPIFGFQVPRQVPGVPDEILDPRGTWADKEAYDAQASKLARLFIENFEQYKDKSPAKVIAAGPRIV
ncbi:MAG: phosphoenolpyruvate carboxykinase (ATP) [Proteobacteria bacterium]|nr:phosphoenolpyruvate carboxykinase (ATP) [Pseudomonadota bacterium]MBU1710167.1 phosphoenolpyruvate carboxykinase (ATP) [Pseudomonadota bacterium]